MTDMHPESPFVKDFGPGSTGTHEGPQFVKTGITREDLTDGLTETAVPVNPMLPFTNDYIGRAKELVYAYVNSVLDKTDTHVKFGPDDVYVVWFCKMLANWKALVSTTLPDGMYYEVTHDGVACYDYVDPYKKFSNVAVPEGVRAIDYFK
jgi:Family of unknown function (DUF6275)